MNIMNLLLKNGKVLDSIDLSNNPIGDMGGHILLNNLVRNSSIVVLKLSNVGLGDDACRDIATLLATNYTIRSVILDYNLISYIGFRRIMESLRHHKYKKFKLEADELPQVSHDLFGLLI